MFRRRWWVGGKLVWVTRRLVWRTRTRARSLFKWSPVAEWRRYRKWRVQLGQLDYLVKEPICLIVLGDRVAVSEGGKGFLAPFIDMVSYPGIIAPEQWMWLLMPVPRSDEPERLAKHGITVVDMRGKQGYRFYGNPFPDAV
jgi:hypothetical protein